jgi:hypothetical protein
MRDLAKEKEDFLRMLSRVPDAHKEYMKGRMKSDDQE